MWSSSIARIAQIRTSATDDVEDGRLDSDERRWSIGNQARHVLEQTTDSPSWQHGKSRKLVVLAVVLFIFMLAVHGFFPGLLYNTAAHHSLVGFAECLSQSFQSLITATCPTLGIPLGAPQLSLVPVTLPAALLTAVGLSSHVSAMVVLGMWLAVAFAGCIALFHRLGALPIAAILGAAAYLLSQRLIGLRGFGGTFSGVALLPTYALIDVLLIQRFMRLGNVPWLGLVGYFAVRMSAVFLDGYSFVMSCVVTAALVIAAPWSGNWERSISRWIRVGGFVAVSNVAAAAIYTWYVPGSGYSRSTMEQFRASGADLISIIAPSRQLWWAQITGVGVDVSSLWGDQVNNRWNYIGWIGAFIAVAFLVSHYRKPWVLPLAVVGAVALVLSLGPSLKVDNRIDGIRANSATADWYVMPSDAATLSLPTQWIFENVPGVNFMRATHRWNAVTVMVVVLCATLGLTALARRSSKFARPLVIGLATLAALEIMPDMPDILATNRMNEISRAAFTPVVEEFVDMTESGETVLFLPFGNAYLANVLVPKAGVFSYTLGGDKNVELSVAAQPDEIITLNESRSLEDGLRAFAETALDAIVLTRYRLRWDASRWPPIDGGRPYLDEFAPLLESDQVEVEYGTWHALIRPVHQS